MGRREGNTVGKGDIARYEQFLCFPTVFSIVVPQTCKGNGVGLNLCTRLQTFCLVQIETWCRRQLELILKKTYPLASGKETLWEKGVGDDFQHFLPFSQCFQTVFFLRDVKTWN